MALFVSRPGMKNYDSGMNISYCWTNIKWGFHLDNLKNIG